MSQFAQALLNWYAKAGRQDLPWQHPRSPYYVWLSEVMLQQTQVATVIPYFERFVRRFPDLPSLAQASTDDVLALWTGLGYYSRARNLHRAAQQIMAQHQGQMPSSQAELEALPGIGRSTAAAIRSQAFNQPAAILDGNVKRVLIRHQALNISSNDAKAQPQLWQLAESLLPSAQPGALDFANYTQAIMDLGATLCKRSKPNCPACPVASSCQALATGQQHSLPLPKASRTKPERERVFLLLSSPEGIWLGPDYGFGVWQDLWQFPSFASQSEALDWLAQQPLIVDSQPESWPRFRHTFSHYHLWLQPVQISVRLNGIMQASGRFTTAQDWPKLGLPKPVLSLLNQWQQQAHS